ncbi:MAG: DUF4114 domain-containing protein [Rubritalea sp.]|uniref:DUF4114 domain-containing protein n=1 Tax=Rubritalea sp. TaxID=2109375 RepID=UPI003242998B
MNYLKLIHKTAFNCLLLFSTASILHAQDVLPQQSTARPFGLDIVGPVYRAGSDADSASFQANDLPVLHSFLTTTLGELVTLDNLASSALDSSQLYLNTASDVRVYFVGEAAAHKNTLGFSTEGIGLTEGVVGLTEGNPQLIFPDNSTRRRNFLNGDQPNNWRSDALPLLPGDFVDLGSFDAGTQLDFFLIGDGADDGEHIFTAHNDVNLDGIQHMVAFAVEGSPFLLIGFEDIYRGGDRDYNDALFAVDIGAQNVTYLANPEPSTWLILLSFIGFIAWTKYRNTIVSETVESNPSPLGL